MIAGSMMITVFVYAKIRHYPVDTRLSFGELLRAFGQAFFALMTPLIIVGGIVGGFVTPTEASVIAVVYSLGIGVMLYRTLPIRQIPKGTL